MKKNYFLSLSHPAKIDYIICFGEAINEIESEAFYKSLFIMKGLFIEVQLDKAFGEISCVELVEDSDVLMKYLTSLQIDLPNNVYIPEPNMPHNP